jgi:cold shock CspA family protein
MMAIMDNFKPLNEPTPVDPNPSSPRIQGKILLINEEGWGFIISEKIPFRRIFFHWTFLENDTLTFEKLEEGMQVEFKPLEIPGKGWRAIKLRVVGE